MLKSNTGSSCLEDAKKAGQEAAQKAVAGLSSVKMAFVYASCDYNLGQLLDGIREVLPEVPVIGNTSYTGVILKEGFVGGDDDFVGVMALAGDNLTVGIAGYPKEASARESGKKIALQAMKNAGKDCAPDYFYMVAAPGEEEFYLKGISDVIGRVPFFGGSAADNTISGNWQLFTDQAIAPEGVAVAFFYTDKPMTNVFTGAYRETGDVGIVTKIADNRTLVEIDGEPSLKKYASWAGVDPETLKGGALLAFTVTSPLGIKDRLGELTAIRHPMNGNEDYSMAIGANLAVNTAVIRMEASVDELIAAAAQTLVALKEKCSETPAAYHLVHCGGRRAGIDSRINEVYEGVKAVAGDVPFIMEFTFGEYGFEDDGNNTIGGLMLSYTALA